MNKFKLIINGNSVRQLNIDILKDAVYGLVDDTDNFIILEPKIPIDNSIYLQAICNDDEYTAETRLIFGSNDNFKHYTKVFGTKEELFEVFSAYYIKNQIPDLKTWIDDTKNFYDSNNDNIEMIKLYKTYPEAIKYFEVWLNDDNISLTIHTGIVGEVGETEDVIYDEKGDLPVNIAMEQMVVQQKEKGYNTINLTELIVQYTDNIKEINSNTISYNQDNIESLLNEGLGWTGNGHCEGGDTEASVTNLFCYVADKDIAVETIVNILEEENIFLPNLKIAYADERTEEYTLLYPNKSNDIFNLL